MRNATINTPIVSNGVQQDAGGYYQWVAGEETDKIDYYGNKVVMLVKRYIDTPDIDETLIDYRPVRGHAWIVSQVNHEQANSIKIMDKYIFPVSCGHSTCLICGNTSSPQKH